MEKNYIKIIVIILGGMATLLSFFLPKLFVYILNLVKNKNIRKKIIEDSENYNFDEKKEFNIYKYIGRKKREEKLGDDYCKTYSEWKSRFIKKYLTPSNCIEEKNTLIINFKRYLNNLYRIYKRQSTATAYVLIPLMIAVTTIMWQIIDGYYSEFENYLINKAISDNEIIDVYNSYHMDNRIWGLVLIVAVVVPIVLYELFDSYFRTEFYEDCLELFNCKNESTLIEKFDLLIIDFDGTEKKFNNVTYFCENNGFISFVDNNKKICNYNINILKSWELKKLENDF